MDGWRRTLHCSTTTYLPALVSPPPLICLLSSLHFTLSSLLRQVDSESLEPAPVVSATTQCEELLSRVDIADLSIFEMTDSRNMHDHYYDKLLDILQLLYSNTTVTLLMFPILIFIMPVFVRITKMRGAVHMMRAKSSSHVLKKSDPLVADIVKAEGRPVVPLKFAFDPAVGVDVVAGSDIPVHTPIIELLGYVKKISEFERQHPRCSGYGFSVNGKPGVVIDCGIYGNESRFFNTSVNSEDANIMCEVVSVNMSDDDDDEQQANDVDIVIIYSTREIVQGERLLLDYGKSYMYDADTWSAPQ